MVQITVASVEWPKEGKKQGAVIDSTGKRWGVWADKLGAFQQFATYEITFKTNEFKGTIYYTIDAAMLVGSNMVRPSTAPPPRMEAPTPSRADYDDNQRRMDIFVCGGFNNIMANPNVNPQALTVDQMSAMAEMLKRTWKRILGPEAQPTLARGSLDNDLNDTIPFE